MQSNIAVLPMQGTDFSEVTEGDSFDRLPHWVPGPKRQIVFQSAGLGRDAGGPSESGRDLLQPRQAQDGSLYFIRKP
jgi:hypothetical protein